MPGGGGGRRAATGLPAPLTLVVVSLFVLMAFETGQAIRDRSALTEVMRTQQPSIEQSAKLRQQLQTLAGKTAELAAAGDAGAQAVVAQMKAQGIALSVPKK
jgi:TolA-binding protein